MIRKQFQRDYKNCIRRPPFEYETNNLTKPIVYCVDAIFQHDNIQSKRCDDFVLFDLPANKAGIYLVERKSKCYDIDNVAAQLQGGANCIRDRLPLNQSFDFFPVLVAQAIRPPALKVLRQKTVSLRGKKKNIRFVKKHGEL